MNLNSKQISEDLKYLLTQLENIHPNPFLYISKEEFSNDLKKLASKQREKKEFLLELMHVFSKIKDSHTRVKGISKVLSGKTYPIRFKNLSNSYYIYAIEKRMKEYMGYKLVSINGLSVSKVVEKFRGIITHENDITLSNAIEQWIYEPDMLEYLRIVGKDQKLEITIEKKENRRETISLVPTDTSEDQLYNPRVQNIINSKTLNPKGIYWRKYFKDIATFYLQYNECEDISKDEIVKLIEEVKDSNSKYVVVDLRNNMGGSSTILDPFTKYLFENQDKYIPVVFISNLTYSAAIINALNILDCKNSISIGTTTSGSPTKFGQTTTITLPNTGIDVVISTKSFEEKGYEFGQPLVPQIETEQTIDEYLNAVDVEWKEFLKLI